MKTRITIVRNTRAPGITPRCGKKNKSRQSCMKPTQHSGPCAYSSHRSSNTRTEKKLHHVSAATKLECAQMIEDPAYRKKLMADLRARRLRPAVECMLWYYAKGKPKEMVEHSGTLSMQQELAALTPQALRGRALEIASLLQHGGKRTG